jgi:hypothetical protein
MTMRFLTSAVVFCAAPLLLALAAPSDQKETTAAAEPHYDTATTIDVLAIVTEVKDVTAGNPLSGAHLMVRLEGTKASSEILDVYLAPADYLKDMDCHFAKGDRIQVKGSKVKFNSGSTVLAREVRMDSNTLYLRDEHGVPYWTVGKSQP